MRRVIKYFLPAWLLFFCSNLSAQQLVRLKSRVFAAPANIQTFNYTALAGRSNAFEGKSFVVIQFNKTLTSEDKEQLQRSGILLQQYVPDNAFTAVITGTVKSDVLLKAGAVSIFEPVAEDKLSPLLFKKKIPSWAITGSQVSLLVHFNPAVSSPFAENYFVQQGYTITDEAWKEYHFITVRMPRHKILELAAIPFVEYIEPIAPAPKTFNYAMRANTRANVLNADPSAGGEGLKGQGVTIGIGDDADPTDHVDLADRVINRAAGVQNVHGTHVTGIAAGGGLKDPLYQGVAPLATIVSQLFNGIFLNAGTYITDYHMVVTNNSWGNITGECDLSGVYDTYSKLMDDISIQYPYLLHVFAAGNDGPFTCMGFPLQYHTIVSGHQSAKNVLSVGWAEKNQTVSTSGSIGPVADGRLKPEITSQGSGLRSTAPNNDYFTDWGTSMAAPTVAGGAALLIEKYRQLNSGNDPKSGLVKALLMNGARDIENPAPDYKSGYGFLHLVRSLDMLKKNRYFISSATTGNVNTHGITVPAGSSQLKVMVYWHDPSAAIFSQNALVNDLDLEVVDPSSATVLPWKLDPSAGGVSVNAVRAADHLNNSEQVTIDNPAAGNYTIRIKGTAINAGSSQEYFVVYDCVPTGVDLTYPSVGEPLVPGEAIVINWDSWGGPANPFTLQLSTDDGASWTNIATGIPSTARQYAWTVPSITAAKAKMRLIKEGTAYADDSQPFVIIGQMSVSVSPVQCEGYINLQWNAVTGATDYEVMMKQGPVMVPVAVTTNTGYVFSGLNRDSTYWVTVRARVNGVPGRRAVAVNRKPASGNCAGNISDNDLEIDSIVSPLSGRKFTSTEITSNNLVLRIKNLDDAPVTGFAIKYSINGSAFVSQNIPATIAAQGTYLHTITGLDFSAPGNYTVTAVVKNNAADANSVNDTATITIRQLPNAPVTFPYTETFDASPAFGITKDTAGLPSLDKWDFINSTDQGRIRSFVNTGIARSGNRALTLDVKKFIPSGNTNYLIGTLNLSNYSSIPPAILGLLLEFSYKHHGQSPHPDNRVWARRSDTDPWIEIFSFDSLQLRPGEWRTVSIPLAGTLAAASPSTSFQLRFGQHGRLSMGDDISNEGITIDDIRLLSAPNDVSIIAIDTPYLHNCAPGNSVPVKINYRVSKPGTACIPVKIQVDGGAIITECAPAATGSYIFNTRIDVAVQGPHMINVWFDDPSDNYRQNDSIKNYVIYTKPVVSAFPYIEDFENGKGQWHSGGYKNSWEYGKPASLKINKAASGTNSWKTRLAGQYNENESSYLYSPCFDISALSSPYLSFNIAMDLEECRPYICDNAWVEYSADGNSWAKLGAYGQGINWYNRSENVWDSANYTAWHVSGISLPRGLNRLQLRFVLSSDAGITREGIAIDDIQIFDKQPGDAGLQWRLYPNPVYTATRLISNHDAGATVTLQLFSASGQLVHQQHFTATGFVDDTPIPLFGLAKGIYALRVSDGRNMRVLRLLKQ